MNMPQQPHGFYDADGFWQRTKFCHVDCGERCTCKPPLGNYRIGNAVNVCFCGNYGGGRHTLSALCPSPSTVKGNTP